MRKIIAIILFVFVGHLITSNVLYSRTVIRSTRVSNSFGINTQSQLATVRKYNAPAASAVNITIKDATGNPEFANSIALAKQYLAEVIKEDFPITIKILIGEEAEFDDSYGTYDHLAITTSNYILSNFENRNPNTINTRNRYINSSNTLIPEALANREYLGDTDPESPDITIKLNPKKITANKFYTGVNSELIPDNQYDLVTVLLREMVTGCGFSSSLRINTFSSMLLASDNSYYPVLYDRFLCNSSNQVFSDILYDDNNQTNISNFLSGKNLNVQGIRILNEDNLGLGLTLNTTNRTYSPNEDINNADLMTSNYSIGKNSVIRKITPATASILNNIGWDIDIVTGTNSKHCSINDQNKTGFTLNPGVQYSFNGNITEVYDYSLSYFDLVLVKSNGDHYPFKKGYSGDNLLTFTYNLSDLPANEEWQRDPENGYIIGYIKLQGSGTGGKIKYNIDGFQRVLLALRPLSVKIAASKQNVTSNTMDANIVYDSNGATKYKINYSIFGTSITNTINVENKEQVAYILSNLDPAKRYSVYVQGINNSGSAYSETVSLGSVYTSASCILTKTGTDVKYQIKVGDNILNDLEIQSAGIYNTSGILKMTVPKIVNQNFSVASLTPGVYVLKVMVKDYGLCTKTFLR